MSYIINAYERVFPVVGGEVRTNWLVPRNVYGTAFYIGKNCFITAGHVVKSMVENEVFGLAVTHGDSWQFKKATDYEIINDFDIGIIKAEVPKAKAFGWNLKELSLLDDIQTVGYPYALDLERAVIRIRAFRGYIVGCQNFRQLKGSPRVYEVSFQSPRGLSGAPLFTQAINPQVVGIIIGNQATEMLVFSSREKLKEGSETIFEKYETLQMGIAVQSGSLANVHSRITEGSLLDHLPSSLECEK